MKLEHKTARDAVVEAVNTIKPMEEKYSNRLTTLIKNAALVISLLTIFSMVILYAYNMGVLSVYNIPNNYISINLQNYIPILIKFCGSYYAFALYYIQLKSDKLLNKSNFNFLKLFYGVIISLSIISWLGFKKWGALVAALSISILIEIVHFFAFKKKKVQKSQEEQLDERLYKQKVENYIHDLLSFLLYNKTGIAFIAIIVLFAPTVGTMRASNKCDYELLDLSGEKYVVIVDYIDSAVMQKATVVEKEGQKELTIDISSYKIVLKENVNIEYLTFKNVNFKEEK